MAELWGRGPDEAASGPPCVETHGALLWSTAKHGLCHTAVSTPAVSPSTPWDAGMPPPPSVAPSHVGAGTGHGTCFGQ